MPDEDIWSWSTTAANNGTADTGIAWPEGQTRASVNNSARGMMAAHAKDRDLRSGAITVTGSVNALTFLSGLNYLTTPIGLTARLKITEALVNTGPCTLEMDARGPVTIIDNTGRLLSGGELIGYQEFRWDGINWVLLNFGGANFSTGDVKLTLKSTADTGWLLMDDTTIGSATSGAAHAAANTQQLFNLLYNNITDEWAPILTSSGTATTRAVQGGTDTAWLNDCRMSLIKQLGRSIAVAGAGADLTTRVLGSTAGAETVTQTVAQMASHSHTVQGSGNVLTSTPFTGSIAPDGIHFGAYPIDAAGGGEPMDVLDPSTFWNVMIKL